MQPQFSFGPLAALLAGLTTLSSASALTLSISSTPPTPSASDVYNFTGTAHDGGNVSEGGTYSDGSGNDGFTYVAVDRPAQGQTFTTGANPKGYRLHSLWVRHVGYSSNTAPTYWKMNANVDLQVRITDPARAGSKEFVCLAESYRTTGSEGWANSHNSPNGSGAWLRFTFKTPITLLPNKKYGFDLYSSSPDAFFEWLGTSTDVFSGGGAYQGSAPGSGDTAINALVGDRVFLVELEKADSGSARSRSNLPPNLASASAAPIIEENSSNSVVLSAAQGVITGKTAKLTRRSQNNSIPIIEFWENPADSVRWHAKVLTPGVFDVILEYAVVGDEPGSQVEVAVGNQRAQGQLETTPNWEIYCTLFLGQVKISQAGVVPVNLSVLEKRGQWVMNLRAIRLRRSEEVGL